MEIVLLSTLCKIIRKEDTIKYNTEHNIVDSKNQIKTGITGGYYCDEILTPFREDVQKEMAKRYPNIVERNQIYQQTYFEQGLV